MMMNINKKKLFAYTTTVLYYCHYITLQWGTEVQPEQLASVQNLRGKVKRSKMTASSHAEIVMTMMEMAPQRRWAEPAHNGFNSFLMARPSVYFSGIVACSRTGGLPCTLEPPDMPARSIQYHMNSVVEFKWEP